MMRPIDIPALIAELERLRSIAAAAAKMREALVQVNDFLYKSACVRETFGRLYWIDDIAKRIAAYDAATGKDENMSDRMATDQIASAVVAKFAALESALARGTGDHSADCGFA